jgi:anti-anti-sigma factor
MAIPLNISVTPNKEGDLHSPVKINLEGRLNGENAAQFSESVSPFLEQNYFNYLVNLLDLTALGTAALPELVLLLKAVRTHEGNVFLVLDSATQPAREIKRMGLDAIFRCFSNEVAAVAAFSLANADSAA